MSHCVPTETPEPWSPHYTDEKTEVWGGKYHTLRSNLYAVETRYEPRTAEPGFQSARETKVPAPFSPNMKRSGKACVAPAAPHLQVLPASASFSCPSPAMSPDLCLKCPSFPFFLLKRPSSLCCLPFQKLAQPDPFSVSLRHCWLSRMYPPGSPSIAFNYL